MRSPFPASLFPLASRASFSPIALTSTFASPLFCTCPQHSVITITNGPYTSDVFTYTAAASTVPPTGNITNPAVAASAGGAGGNTDLGASPTNLQVRSSALCSSLNDERSVLMLDFAHAQIAGATTSRSLASAGALGVALVASLSLLVC